MADDYDGDEQQGRQSVAVVAGRKPYNQRRKRCKQDDNQRRST